MARLITLYLLGFPVSLKNCLASFQAVSTDSPPPEEKNTLFRSPGAAAAIRSASSIAVGCAYDQIGKNASFLACVAAAWTSSSRPCPTCTTNSQDSASRYRLPLLSQM